MGSFRHCKPKTSILALAGITITDERKKAIDFSDGYYKSGLLVMVKANNNDVKKRERSRRESGCCEERYWLR